MKFNRSDSIPHIDSIRTDRLPKIDVIRNEGFTVSNKKQTEVEKDNFKPSLEGLSTYDKVKLSCEYVLSKENINSESKSLKGGLIFEKANSEFDNEFSESPSKNTFIQYLSNTVKDPDSRINCLGKKKGYYLLEIVEPVDVEINDDEGMPDVKRQMNKKEKLLYPVLESWLVAQGYQSSDVSTSKSLGVWGNPDIAGLHVIDTFNGLSIELTTIEAKVSIDQWEKWIFEAVSHRRFANRSYFAFAHPSETIHKITGEMRYYAELYNIGVIVLSLDDDVFEKLKNGNLNKPIDADEVEIVELYSAPFNYVQPKYQVKFCDAHSITCAKQLYQWGKISN